MYILDFSTHFRDTRKDEETISSLSCNKVISNIHLNVCVDTQITLSRILALDISFMNAKFHINFVPSNYM